MHSWYDALDTDGFELDLFHSPTADDERWADSLFLPAAEPEPAHAIAHDIDCAGDAQMGRPWCAWEPDAPAADDTAADAPAAPARIPAKRASGARGGNLSRAQAQTRHMIVRQRDGIAQYEVTAENRAKIHHMRAFIAALPPGRARQNGPQHPELGVSALELTREEYGGLANAAFGRHVANPDNCIKRLQQFLCELGMAPAGSFAKGNYERVFDASLWNQNGYRLVKGGRLSHGHGRPLVVFSHDAVAEAAWVSQ